MYHLAGASATAGRTSRPGPFDLGKARSPPTVPDETGNYPLPLPGLTELI